MSRLKNPVFLRALVSWLFASATLCVTAFSGSELLRGPRAPAFAPSAEPEAAEFSSASLEDYINRRIRSLDHLERIPRAAGPRAVMLNRPQIAVRGLALLGQKRVAALAVGSAAQTAIVSPGDEIAGITVLTIEENGVTCEWRGQEFFVPMR